MIVNEKNQLGILIQDNFDFKEKIFNTQIEDVSRRNYDAKDKDKSVKKATETAFYLVFDQTDYPNNDFLEEYDLIDIPTHTYMLKEDAQHLANKIPLDKFDYKILRQVGNKKCLYLMGKDEAFKFYIANGNLYGVLYKSADINNQKSIEWRFFRIDIDKGKVHLIKEQDSSVRDYIGNDTYISSDRGMHDNPTEDAQFKRFIKTLLFIELSELEIQVLEPNKKVGKTKSDKIINRTKSNVIVVTHKWNVMSIRTDSFLVSGHWRMQPCGINRANRKLIYVDTFEKRGYIRRNKPTKAG